MCMLYKSDRELGEMVTDPLLPRSETAQAQPSRRARPSWGGSIHAQEDLALSPVELVSMEVLLTGGTGFVGKSVLLHLCSEPPAVVRRVHLLIRPGGSGQSAEARFNQLLASSAFDSLPQGWTHRVSVQGGDVALPGLGCTAEAISALSESITHIVHCAATIEFDLPLREAAALNVGGTLNMLEFAHSCVNGRRLIYCSSAYASPLTEEPILEELPRFTAAQQLADPDELYSLMMSDTLSPLDTLALLRNSGHPNTYTLTKCVAELLLAKRRREHIALSIVRPSIIGCAALRPFPGWNTSKSGIAAFAYLVRLGALHTISGLPNSTLDCVPVDVVAARIVAEATADAVFACSPRGDVYDSIPLLGRLLKVAAPPPPPPPSPPLTITHVVAGRQHSVTIKEVVMHMCGVFSSASGPLGPAFIRVIAPKRTLAQSLSVRRDLIAVDLRWALAALLGQRRLGAQARLMRERMLKLHDAFEHFTHKPYDFRMAAATEPFDRIRCLELLAKAVDDHVASRLPASKAQWHLSRLPLMWALTALALIMTALAAVGATRHLPV